MKVVTSCGGLFLCRFSVCPWVKGFPAGRLPHTFEPLLFPTLENPMNEPIDVLPRRISREALVDAIKSLGLEPSDIYRFEYLPKGDGDGVDALDVTVFARPNGADRVRAREGADQYLKYSYAIPVI